MPSRMGQRGQIPLQLNAHSQNLHTVESALARAARGWAVSSHHTAGWQFLHLCKVSLLHGGLLPGWPNNTGMHAPPKRESFMKTRCGDTTAVETVHSFVRALEVSALRTEVPGGGSEGAVGAEGAGAAGAEAAAGAAGWA